MTPFSFNAIEAAYERIRPYIRPTPFLPLQKLSEIPSHEIWLKCELFQLTGSFKFRGATHCILQNLEQAKKNGVIAASAGNHAQGVSAICAKLGISATLVMPKTTPSIKVKNTQAWGAKVVLHGEVYDDASSHAMDLAAAQGLLFIHPFRDPNVILGQATVGLELLNEPQFEDIEAVVIAIGGGGLITGCAAALKARRPDLKIYGVTAKNAPSVYRSFKDKKVCAEPVTYTLADTIATKHADATMLGYLSESVDDVFSIGEESIAHAIAVFAERAKMVVEGAGAIPLAAVLEHKIPEKKLAIVVCGGNIDLPSFSNVLERGLAEQNRLVTLDIQVPDRPGGLARLTTLLSTEGANILQIFHRRGLLGTQLGEVQVEVQIQTRDTDHTNKVISAIRETGFQVLRTV